LPAKEDTVARVVDLTPQRPEPDTATPERAQPTQPTPELPPEPAKTEKLAGEGGPARDGDVRPQPIPEVAAGRQGPPGAPVPVPSPGFSTKELDKSSEELVALLYNVQGSVMLKRSGTDKWLRGAESDKLFKGDSIKTGTRDSGVALLKAGGAVVFNRSSILNFESQTECGLEKGEVLASGYRQPLVLKSAGVRVQVRLANACIQRRTRDVRVVAASGTVQVDPGTGQTCVPAGSWVCGATKSFRIWVEGECSKHTGYCVVQQGASNLSNCASLYKTGTSAQLCWLARLVHAMPCYIWVRYSRASKEPEDIALHVNGVKIEEKTIKPAAPDWVWVKAFKVALDRRNEMMLSFTSKKPAESYVDLVLLTNDPSFKPTTDVPKDGYYGKK
jgi:hypothetical protein